MLQVVCGECETVNRVATGRDPLAAKCGRCGVRLFGGKPVEVTGAGLDRRRRQSDSVALLLDVWAPWCGPCKVMAPQFAAAAPRLEPQVQLLKLNSDAEPAAAGALGVRSIPTLILFLDGREAARASGAMTADQIIAWTRRSLGRSAAA